MQRKNQSNLFKNNFQELLNFVSDAVMIMDHDGLILTANRAAAEILGFEVKDLIQKNLDEFNIINEKTKEFTQKQIEKRAAGELLENYEIPIIVKGETRYFEQKVNKINYFGQQANLIILHDVTERRKSQSQLLGKIAEMDKYCQQSEEKLVKLFQESMDAIILIDAETGIIVDCNPAASLLVGMDISEIVGQNCSIIRPKSLRKAGYRDMRDFASKRCPTEPFETEIRTKSGENKYVSIRISFFDLQGKKMIQGTFRDVTDHKMMQQALLENEEKFHGIASSVRDAIVLVNNEAKVTYWNPAAEKTFGYLASEAVGKSIHKLVVPNARRKEVKDCIDLSLKAFAETGTGYFTVGSVELIGQRKDGTEFPAELAISPIKLGGKWHAVGVVKDITNSKKAQEKIREAEQRYHALFDEAPLGVLVIDPETAAFVEFNNVAHFQLGYSSEEFGKLTICDIEAKETSSEVKSHISEMVRTGGGEFETLHRTKNGEIRNVLVTTRTIELPNKILLHAVFHDITEIRKGQNALIESEARYRQLVEIAQAGIWAINKDFSTVFVNPRMAEMLGYTEIELIGKNLFEFVDRDLAERVRKILEQFNQPGAKGQFEYSFPRKDGTHINTSLAISTITDDQGHVIGELALVADITERKRLEDELRESEERFRAISDSAIDAIILVDEEGNVMYWNPAAERIFALEKKR